MLRVHIGRAGRLFKSRVGRSLQPMTAHRTSFAALAAASALFVAAAAWAHDPASHATGQHAGLQVLPKDIPHDRLIEIMKGYSSALGVKCTHCHEGSGGKMDFASEAKPQKQTARAMMLLVKRINEQDFQVKDWKDTKVTCYTCHRGAVKPLTAPAPAEPAA
jgi:hypothetical protein